jgi:nucleoside-diphosphate-sugar epimerase
LPTVIAQRKPTSAATAYSYNIPNKLLNGEDYVIPVKPNYKMPFIWIEDTIRALIAIHNLNEELLSLNKATYRVINVTGISVSTKNWVQEIKNIAKKNKVNIGNVTWEEDAFTLELLNSAINEIEGSLAAMHNISPRTSISEMVQNIIDEKRVKKL